MKTEARTLLAEVVGRGREGGQSEGKAKMHTPMAASRGAAVRRQSDSASVPLWGDRVGPVGPPHQEQWPLPRAAPFSSCVLKEAPPTRAAWLIPTNHL